MALRIASVPVLRGKAADRFDDLMAISENKYLLKILADCFTGNVP